MTLNIDEDRIEDVAARLDLRPPNKGALESVVYAQSDWFDVDQKPAPFECVVDSATGVGKTFVIGALIEYAAGARAVRNFAVICPNKTIVSKTIDNFTPGHPKSIVDNMESRPLVITADNFAAPSTRSALDDDSQVKLYIFTVQALTRPDQKVGRKTHEFQEGLGDGFYNHLSTLDDLMLLADEHHLYQSPAFSKTITELCPNTVVGLTATPDPKTPADQIVWRYPLAAAIADGWVKAPVIVGRRDDRTDQTTQFLDGITLLRYKAEFLDAYCAENSRPTVNPIMLVIANDTDEADEVGALLRSDEFDAGRWKESVLIVHSNFSAKAKEKAFERLADVDDPDSPIRIIVSVAMLKEGWDSKNVYVLCSLRPSVSEVLTEQTLGRGLRTPFGKATGIELLDTLEVIAHERYEAMLRSKNVLAEQFIDHRTRAVLKKNASGETVVVKEESDVAADVVTDEEGTGSPSTSTTGSGAPQAGTSPATPGAHMTSLENRSQHHSAGADALGDLQVFAPSPKFGPIRLPKLVMTRVTVSFSLADIVDTAPFTELGRQIAKSPETELQRTKISARIVTGADGLQRTEMVTSPAVDKVDAATPSLSLDLAVARLTDSVLAAPIVPARPSETRAVKPIIEAFREGLGQQEEQLLAAFGERAAARLIRLITAEHRKNLPVPKYDEVVDWIEVANTRETRRRVSYDPHSAFDRTIAYDSRDRSIYKADWFDSAPEFTFANIVDASSDVRCWVRLLRNDLAILWRSDGRNYNADFIVIENDDNRWVVEVKADRDVSNDEVQAKRIAAKRWANHVNKDASADSTWHYLLISETDLAEAKGLWAALKALIS